MESDPDSHPMSNVGYINDQLAPVLKDKRDVLAAGFAAADTDGVGTVSYDVMQDVLMSNDMELNDQVLITLLRRFDLNKDGNIAYNDMLELAK